MAWCAAAAFGVHHFHQGIDDQRIEAAQRRVFTHEQVRFGAEAVNHARQLNGDIARATTATRFGSAGSSKKPSESMPYSAPGIDGWLGGRRWRSGYDRR
jgi:hypothetical protein